MTHNLHRHFLFFYQKHIFSHQTMRLVAHNSALYRYMKYLYPFECERKGLSSPGELQAAIDSNRREGRRASYTSSLYRYSPSPSSAPHHLMPSTPTTHNGLSSSASPTLKKKTGRGHLRCSLFSPLEQDRLKFQTWTKSRFHIDIYWKNRPPDHMDDMDFDMNKFWLNLNLEQAKAYALNK